MKIKKTETLSLSFELLILAGLLFFTISTFVETLSYSSLMIFYYFVLFFTTKKLTEAEYRKKIYLIIIIITTISLFSLTFILFLNNLYSNHFIETHKSLSTLILFAMYYSYFSIVFAVLIIILLEINVFS
ncbi:MAG: hypothetical protein QW038_02030 [Nanopusillaceae archaeon]